MFFNRFPKHKYANIRISTTGSRHRDCAALMSYGYITELLGMDKLTQLMDWVFVEQIGTDIDRMMGSDDELTDDFSYFPYHVDLGLVLKSAYSASANPHFFEWVHLVGTMMRASRSCNARHLTEARAADIFANAACLAYVYSSSITFTKVYTVDGNEYKFDEDQGDEDVNDEELLYRSKDPIDWVTLMKSRGGELPPRVKEFIDKIARASDSVREGTMQAYFMSVYKVYVD